MSRRKKAAPAPEAEQSRRHERRWSEGTVVALPGGKWRAWRARQGSSRPSRTFKGEGAEQRAKTWAKGDTDPPVLLLGHWLDRWLALRLPTLRATSRQRYRRFVVQCGPLALVPLVEVTTERLQERMNALLAGHARNTVSAWRTVIASALKAAVPGHFAVNPMRGTRLPKATERPVKAWTADEVGALLAAARGRAHETWLWVSLGTGIRLGEARALRWADINLADRTATISRSLDHRTNAEGPTKNGKTRIVDLPDELVPILTAHRARQRPHEARVCTSAHNGRLPSAGAIEKWLPKIVEAAGVTAHSCHATRHSFATLALDAGAPLKDVSEQLGHSDIAITARIYSHNLRARSRRAAGAIGTVLVAQSGIIRGLKPAIGSENGSEKRA